jgi:uncharacterized protein
LLRVHGGDRVELRRNSRVSHVRTSDDALLVFVKAPCPGQVKTRLGPELTPRQASDLYRAMVEDLLDRLGSAPGPDLVLFYDPPEAALLIADWLGHDRLRCPQAPGDLGARLPAAFSWAFAQGYRRVLVAGSDIPTLDRAEIAEAVRNLCDHDLVISPAPDGGYSLVGLKQEQPRLFWNIPWSTPRVLSATLARAGSLGLSTQVLPSLPDVDTFADLERLWLEEGPRLALRAPRTTGLLREFLAQAERRTDVRA